MVGAILAGLLLGFLSEELGVASCDFAAQMFVVAFDVVEALECVGVPTFPVAGLLPQFEIVAA